MYVRLTIFSANAILNSTVGVPLRGIAIGNGWIDPRRQYPTYIDFAVKVGLLEENSEVRIFLHSSSACSALPHPSALVMEGSKKKH